VEYPDSDHRVLGETSWHHLETADLFLRLRYRYGDTPAVFVAGRRGVL